MSLKKSATLSVFLGLAACASLPSSGPTGGQIIRSATAAQNGSPINVVELSSPSDIPVPERPAGEELAKFRSVVPPPTDMVGPGDVLDISIYEAGVALFSPGSSAGSSGVGSQMALDPGVKVQKLPPMRVDDDGDIVIPYAGKLRVAGSTIGEVETKIRKSLRGLSENPQIIVTPREVITNTVIVGGEVSRPGRLILQTNRETLSDVVALAGGYRGSAKDLMLRLTRRNESIDVRLGTLTENPLLDINAYPGDKLTLVNRPLTYSVLGASGRVEQLPFSQSNISLAEAVASAGGVNPGFGDPKAIFVFRFANSGGGQNKEPVVYHLNMMTTRSYFLSQHFMMQDKDVLYFGNATANQPTKMVQLISQLFSPILTLTSAVQVVQKSGN